MRGFSGNTRSSLLRFIKRDEQEMPVYLSYSVSSVLVHFSGVFCPSSRVFFLPLWWPASFQPGTLALHFRKTDIPRGDCRMETEAQLIMQRASLRWLAPQHPNWTQQELALTAGKS